jgi:hypothetical protein
VPPLQPDQRNGNVRAGRIALLDGELNGFEMCKTIVRVVAKTRLESRDVDPSTMIRYESVWRLHVKPEFGWHGVGSIRPSQIQAFIATLKRGYSQSTAAGAYLVLQGILALAVTDGLIKASPAKSETVTKPRAGLVGSKVVAWTDDEAAAVIDGSTATCSPGMTTAPGRSSTAVCSARARWSAPLGCASSRTPPPNHPATEPGPHRVPRHDRASSRAFP